MITLMKQNVVRFESRSQNLWDAEKCVAEMILKNVSCEYREPTGFLLLTGVNTKRDHS